MPFELNIVTIWILIVAALLGIKHSIDADHVAATSSILFKSHKFTKMVKLSSLWALGHTVTAGIITLLLFLAKDIFFSSYLNYFEIIVAIMLISIGAISLLWEMEIIKKPNNLNEMVSVPSESSSSIAEGDLSSKERNLSTNDNLKVKNEAKAITTIGIIQGLAYNDELLLLLTFTLGLDNFFIILLGLIIFSLGVMIGMILWGTILKIPKSRHRWLLKSLNVTIAIIAIIYGVYILLGGESINLFLLISG